MKTKMEDMLRCVQEQRAGTLNVGMMIGKDSELTERRKYTRYIQEKLSRWNLEGRVCG